MNEKGIFAPKDKSAIWTIPNLITASGFIFIGLYVKSFFCGSSAGVILLFLFLAGMTDALDGISARFLKQETIIGEILDPARDRALMLAVLLHLARKSSDSFVGLAILAIFVFEIQVMLLHIGMPVDNRKMCHLYGKTRQAGHLFCATLAILEVASIEIAIFAMLIFSIIALHGAIIGRLAKKEERRMV
ncbi:CDP-alcohol phosphatidyltransferase family protein [Patescibacteria group bacterium]|nr:CDP-alcohol phosphatidyltransferase family protein [Patescibacteria group bacterium]MBU4353358.1 CDP-alcohol phosphatidyltransferase family protein [Patescibacteria group bacterium]MBU4476945.1 CDP-alcohol phosphatidyltransferase family protein [Patescibacteria group bacterium]MCG2699035.1 CDP-alcohol phosphatidyltransferase family protein [Candidatus Parcubacteria bacterium]